MITAEPKISVLMPVYNGAGFLKQAINSILNQTFTEFELLLINDGSTDDSEKIVQSINDPRLRYIKNETNLGLIATLNKGLLLCKGRYIARMDADDVALPERLQKQFAYLEAHKEVSALATRLQLINGKGEFMGFWNDDYDTNTRLEIETNMPKLNCIGHPTIMMRAEVVRKFRYNSAFKGSEDWGLWLFMLSSGHVIDKLDEALLHYRVHDAGTTVTANKQSGRKRIMRFKRKYIFQKLKAFALNTYDLKVLRYWLIDVLNYYLPIVYTFLVKYAATTFTELIKQQKAFKTYFKNFPEDGRAIFFFPFYHLGGAELVHTQILEAVAHTRPLVLFTSSSGSGALLPEFKRHANTLMVDQLLIWPYTKRKVMKALNRVVQQQPAMQLFSSNSRFYYDYLQTAPEGVKAMDLMHAFMHEHEDSAEKWSLPVVQKLKTRVVINQKTAADFKKQYRLNGLPESLLSRIQYISNYVDTCLPPHKNFTGIVKVLYVGRGTAEKRVYLLAKVAHQLRVQGRAIEFHFAGDVAAAIPSEYKLSCVLHGELRDRKKLDALYHEAHVLAISSTREGFPMVIMEGMMHGVVPISTNVGGVAQHVLPGENGFLIDEESPEKICERFVQLITLMDNDRQKLKQLSANSRDYALQHFNKQHFVEAYFKLFTNGLQTIV